MPFSMRFTRCLGTPSMSKVEGMPSSSRPSSHIETDSCINFRPMRPDMNERPSQKLCAPKPM